MNTGFVLTTRNRADRSTRCAALVGMVLSVGLTALLPAQTLTLGRPNGGESLTVGDRHAIHWDWTDSISAVNLEYSTDGGSTWNIVLSSLTNEGDALWTIPNTPATACRMKVTSAADSSVYDASDTDFTIARPVLTVGRPGGGESWTVGEKHPIHWSWAGTINSVNIEYSTDGGSTWNMILSGTTNDGDALWTVPNAVSATCRVKITDQSDTSCFDVSDSDFSIVSPTISVVRPDSGETYYAGGHAPIHWASSGSFSTVKLEYSTDGGGAWTTIVSSTNNDGDYCWSVPGGLSSTTCRVRITNTDDPNSYDVSAADFTIDDFIPSDSLHLFSPRSDDAWLVGGYYYICWTHAGSNSTVKLDYTTDGGSTWTVIAASTPNDGEFEWLVPNYASENCRIRVSSTANPAVKDESDLFTISKQWIQPSSPMTGDAWMIGTHHYITWTWGGQFSNVKLQYSTDRGSTWSQIVAGAVNSGVYEWTATEPPSANSQVKITNTANTDAFGISDVFRATPQTIEVTSPLAGDGWQVSRYYYITWNWAGQFTSVKLQYSTDRGATWRGISSEVGNSGCYEWQVPNAVSTNCEVKITSTANSAVYAVSDVFAIQPHVGISELPSGSATQGLAAGPNPSRGRVSLRYVLAGETEVDLSVLDASGRRVRTLVQTRVPAGVHSIVWDRRAESGKLLPAGVYFCRMAAGKFQTIDKLIVQ